jgi:Fe-S-cluster containining protein
LTEAAATAALDCQRCGACCVNLPSNRATGVVYWVELATSDRLLARADLVRKHVTRDAHGVPHLRMAHDGRCLALRGPLGEKVACGIYRDRPSPCRRVQPGDDACLRSRRAHGLEA